MAEEAAAHHLLNVLEERDLNVDLDNVLATFEDDATRKEAAAWVNEYLNEETLLSREELELYQFLNKKGILHQYENSEDPIRPLLDHELSTAIDSLQASTAAIEEQCRVLEAQKEALMALKALDKPNMDVEHARNERRRKENQEKARLDIAVEDVTTSLEEQLSDTQRDVEAEKSTLKTYLTERLASDDKILTALPNIVAKIVADPEVNGDEKSVDQWCKAIVSFRTAEIKARVDATYLNSLRSESSDYGTGMSEEDLREQKEALQAELETLHSEIASVAEMVVEHELRKPIDEIEGRTERERSQARVAWFSYVISTLEYMGKRLEIMTSHTNNVNEFQHALAQVESAASKRMSKHANGTEKPSIRRATSGPRSVFAPALNLKPSMNLELPPALQDALRHAGLSFNQESIEALRESVIETLLEREQKLTEHYSSASSSTHERLSERFGKADIELHVILDALYSNTKFKQVTLTNEVLGDEIKRLEKEVTEADQKLLNAETEGLSLNDLKVRSFVEKYS